MNPISPFLATFAAGVLFASAASQAQTPPPPPTQAATPRLAAAREPVTYAVILRKPSLAAMVADARAQGRSPSPAEQKAYLERLRSAQAALVARIEGAGGTTVAQTSRALNALYVRARPDSARRLAAIDGVRSVQEVGNLRTQADPASKEVTPWIGAERLRTLGIDGRGVRVAVLDSGIDYTHAAFGGAGTPAAYLAAYGLSQLDPANKGAVAWPQGRVVGGYDFVGENWPYGDLEPDPDPIAAPPPDNDLGLVGTDGSHGTSVADILAGGPYPARPDNFGIAPGVSLYAVKVCSALTPDCSGLALIQGIDWALDPNGDGNLADAVDVINLSLGANFGQRENPSVEAATNASRLGVVVCAAAGNGGDTPYILSSPASAPEAIAVAQTSMPGDRAFHVQVDSPNQTRALLRNTASLPWAPLTSVVTGRLMRPADPLACALLAPASLGDRIALIDRGDCDVSYKVAYAQAAGARAVLLVSNTPGDPPSHSYGGIPWWDLPEDFVLRIPALVVSQADGATLVSRLAAGQVLTVTLSPSVGTDLSRSIVGTSSRGPGYNTGMLKPELSAPGASRAAVSGSGTGLAVFGGTSGATPVVAGAAALLRQQYPGLAPLEVKARLMNTAAQDVFVDRRSRPGLLTGVSRSGAGEVQAAAALQARATAWVVGASGAAPAPALSFGYWRLSAPQTFTKVIRVKNHAANARDFTVRNASRGSPGQPGAVVLGAPPTLRVPGGGTADLTVTLTVDPAKLPPWQTDSGFYGADGGRLAAQEFDGFIELSEGTDQLSLPWHILPHRAHRGIVSTTRHSLGGAAPTLANSPSAAAATASLFALTGTSPRLPAGSYPGPGDAFAVTDLQHVGVRLVNYGAPYGLALEFAITTWDRRTHANYPAQFVVTLDVDRDGVGDWYLFNQRLGAAPPDWRNAVFLQGVFWYSGYGTFFTNVDFNSANVILQVPLNRIGRSVPWEEGAWPVADPLPPGQTIDFTVQVYDNYFTGLMTDQIGPMTYTPASPRYVVNGGLGAVEAAPGASAPIPISATGSTLSPSQSGVLLMFTHGRTRFESHAIEVAP